MLALQVTMQYSDHEVCMCFKKKYFIKTQLIFLIFIFPNHYFFLVIILSKSSRTTQLLYFSEFVYSLTLPGVSSPVGEPAIQPEYAGGQLLYLGGCPGLTLLFGWMSGANSFIWMDAWVQLFF